MSQSWTWSAEHNDHFYATNDAAGNVVYVWASQQTAPATTHRRVDSVAYDQSPVCGDDQTPGAVTEQPAAQVPHQDALQSRPADPVPYEVRQRLPNFIAGTPTNGWYEQLDQTYRMRTGAEARDFFRVGRVFSMLFSEIAGATARPAPDDEAFTVVRFGAQAHTQIRRFVVVSVRRNFVLACAISTYRNQGTFKRGCDPSEHALVYNQGVSPEACYFPGERERGLYKEPIEVIPVDFTTLLTKESRIRFGKIYSIEWNVKVKDIGVVVEHHLGTLIEHFNFENRRWDTAN